VIHDGYLVSDTLAHTGERIWPNLPFTPSMRRRFEAGDGPRLMLRRDLVNGATIAFRADLRPFLLPIPACWVHDAWIGLLAAALGETRTVPKPLILYRLHGEQQIGTSRRTWRRQVRFLGRMGEDYFANQCDRFNCLWAHLRVIEAHLRDRSFVQDAAAKLGLVLRQREMRRLGRLRRVELALDLLFRGSYHRYARGLRSFVADALAR
jgi:hypothetical protein